MMNRIAYKSNMTHFGFIMFCLVERFRENIVSGMLHNLARHLTMNTGIRTKLFVLAKKIVAKPFWQRSEIFEKRENGAQKRLFSELV